MTAMDITSMF